MHLMMHIYTLNTCTGSAAAREWTLEDDDEEDDEAGGQQGQGVGAKLCGVAPCGNSRDCSLCEWAGCFARVEFAYTVLFVRE